MFSVLDDDLGDASRPDTALDQALTGGRSQTVGQFRFYIDAERWEWSDEVQVMHGYTPGVLPNPTTAQVLAHKHPDDYDHVADALEDTRRTGTAFSTRHRMIDTAGKQHQVVVVGDQLRDDAGAVIGTHGFYIDVTPAHSAEDERISAAIAEISENRAELYRGASPSNDGTELSTAVMPEGFPMTIAPERREEFAPGLDKELLALIQATAEVEIATNGAVTK
jgi:fructose-specific component phosphotransferase system IIB-like protein